MRGNDAIHLGLMLLAFAASYLVPFELLLLAYVVLGPAHYFTEISWLHDRSYYLPHRGIAAALAIIAVVAALIDNASWFGFAMWGALIVCAMLAATNSAIESMLLFMVAIGLSAIMYSSGSSLAVIGVLIPTLIHVSLFTLIFMVLGAYRSGSRIRLRWWPSISSQSPRSCCCRRLPKSGSRALLGWDRIISAMSARP